jgi:K+-sensing histidine kinase KdpD
MEPTGPRTLPSAATASAAARLDRRRLAGAARDYGLAAALVALATAIGALARLQLSELVMVYLLGVVIAAARFGRGPSLLAAALSIAVFDFFFIPPRFTLGVAEDRHVLTFAIMLVVSLLTSGLTLRIRKQERAARDAAIRAHIEETRSSLLSAVSHDLRTPLAAITGAATTLRDEGAAISGAQQADLLDTICEEAERLERLVRNLLDLTRLESGALEVRREWMPLEEIVGSALMRLEARLDGRPIRTDLSADLPLLSVDAVLVEQALVNLLENAAKYTPAGSEIAIAAHADAHAVSIDVADRGPGLTPGEEARIFDKFFRGRGAGSGTAGAGLGLAICRGVAHAHHGTLVASNRPGGGALFRMTLPIVGKAPATPAELDEAAPAQPEPPPS